MTPQPATDPAAHRRRRLTVIGAALAVLALIAIVAVALGGSDGHTSSSGSGSASSSSLTATASTGSTSPATSTTTTVATTTTTTIDDPGALPQTSVQPTTTSATFQRGVEALWKGIVTDDAQAAAPFFFPLSAYRQVKGISDPEHDYRTRLLANYAVDLSALHRQLGADASRAQLVGLDVPAGAAVWIRPGVEYNKGAYWRVYGSRLRYTIDGVAHSFPVTSLISWRGEWYVVHLGSIR